MPLAYARGAATPAISQTIFWRPLSAGCERLRAPGRGRGGGKGGAATPGARHCARELVLKLSAGREEGVPHSNRNQIQTLILGQPACPHRLARPEKKRDQVARDEIKNRSKTGRSTEEGREGRASGNQFARAGLWVSRRPGSGRGVTAGRGGQGVCAMHCAPPRKAERAPARCFRASTWEQIMRYA